MMFIFLIFGFLCFRLACHIFSHSWNHCQCVHLCKELCRALP